MGSIWKYFLGVVGLSGFGLKFIVEDVIVDVDFIFKIIIISGIYFMLKICIGNVFVDRLRI